MIYGVYSIRDCVAGEYLAPMLDTSDATAIRNFRHTVLTSPGVLSTHPGDFELVHIGSFNTSTAEFIAQPYTILLKGDQVK
ncbi:nonstructural protein [Microvirus mar28]|uniref:Nonstructural protein n=1 Tax=Microvirus mar28 TaxID=2851161 RepID=A0A8F5MJ44_9VIRU|nr:nonstructural protein [Microvirus mar28]